MRLTPGGRRVFLHVDTGITNAVAPAIPAPKIVEAGALREPVLLQELGLGGIRDGAPTSAVGSLMNLAHPPTLPGPSLCIIILKIQNHFIIKRRKKKYIKIA